MAPKLLIYLTTSRNLSLYQITHLLQRKKRNEKAAEANEKRLRIKVFNYRQELRDKSSLRRRWQSSIKISYCLSPERISK